MAHAQFPPGTQLHHYVVVEEIARGGQGVVLAANDMRLGTTVALKLLLDMRPQAHARFLREARTLAQLEHPGLVRIPDFGQLPNGVPFLVMQYVQGDDLERRVRKEGVPDPAWTVRILTGVAEALDYCHQRGVIHRDIKPKNIVVTGDGERALLVDFGLAKHAAHAVQGLTGEGELLGTPAYMAPEQASGSGEAPVDVRADVYALGAVLYFLLSGNAPFTGATRFNTLRAVLEDAPEDPRAHNPQAPAELVELCLACLAKDPAQRPASAGQVARRLRAIGRHTQRLERGRPARWPVAVMLLGLLAAAAIVLSGDPATAPLAASPTPTQSVETRSVTPQPSDRESGDPALPLSAQRRRAIAALAQAVDGDWHQSIAACSSALALDPAFPEAYATRGQAYAKLRRCRKAADDFGQAAKLEPTVARYHVEQGRNALDADAHAEGREAVRVGLGLDPDLATAALHAQVGYASWSLRDYAAAVEAYSAAIRLEPQHALHYGNRGVNQEALGDLDAALADFDRALELEALDFIYPRRGALRLARKDFAGAEADFTQAIELMPNQAADFHMQRALCRSQLGNLAGYMQDARRAMELDPTLMNRAMHELKRALDPTGQ